MRNKRQTIWLVSMLGLMVVLSAYYLFTDDVNEMDIASADFNADEIALSAIEQSELAKELTMEELTGEDLWSEEHSGHSAEMEEVGTLTNEEILKQVEAQATSGQDFFTSMQLERMEEMDKESDQLLRIITDSNENTSSMNQAFEKLQQMEDQLSKMTNIEEQLMEQFSQVFIEQDNNQWKVYVQSNNLEKSQAVSILDTVMNELGTSASQVVIQRVP